MKTLKYLIGAAAAVALLATGSSVFAADNVTATKHNLSTSGTGTVNADTGGTDQICVFCHTPHSASATAKPLWNRSVTSSGYTMYNSSWSSTIDGAVDPSPGGVSAACLSCHDGQIALDAILNPPGTATPTEFDTANVMANTSGTETMTGNANLGLDLTNDHPISIEFAVLADEFQAPTNAKIYNGKVECGSCHNPHDATEVPFLRTTNDASALCKDCHLK